VSIPKLFFYLSFQEIHHRPKGRCFLSLDKIFKKSITSEILYENDSYPEHLERSSIFDEYT